MQPSVRTVGHVLKHLAVQLAVAGGTVTVVALVVYAAEGTTVAHAFVIALIAVGALAVILGAVGFGGGSPAMARKALGPLSPPGQGVVNATKVLVLTGSLLIVAGILVDIGRREGHTASAAVVERTCFETWSPDDFIEVAGSDPRGYRVVDVEEYEGYLTDDPSGSGRGCAYRFHDSTSYAEIDVPTDPLGDPVGPSFAGDSGNFDFRPGRDDLAYNGIVLPDGRLEPLEHRRVLPLRG